MSENKPPFIWAVVLGWNHAEDTIECLHSLKASRGLDPAQGGASLKLLYTDNGSTPDQVEKVFREVPDAAVIRHPKNVGVPRGFNGGLAYALQHGADYVFMANNDTAVAPDCVRILLDAAEREPETGFLMPRIFYYDHKDLVWSAGSRFRRFPPAIIMRKGRSPADAFDREEELEFSSLCTVLMRGRALKDAGLMDPNIVFYYEDYDLSLRVREAGYTIKLIPAGRSWHKVARITREGQSSPAFWTNYGRSVAIFRRRHRRHRWLTGPVNLAYLLLRAAYEGKPRALPLVLAGLREGRSVALQAVPRWDTPSPDPIEVVRAG